MLRLLRSPRLRALALLVQVAALFCQLSEGTGREHCPHHDLPASAGALAHGAGHEHHQDHGRSHSCHCLGDCATGFVALPPAAPVPLRAAGAGRDQVATLNEATPAAPQYRLPPSIGPPLSA